MEKLESSSSSIICSTSSSSFVAAADGDEAAAAASLCRRTHARLKRCSLPTSAGERNDVEEEEEGKLVRARGPHMIRAISASSCKGNPGALIMSAGARRDERSGQGDERARLPPGRATTRVQEWVADLGDPGAPVALPHAAVPLLRPRHYVRPTAVSLSNLIFSQLRLGCSILPSTSACVERAELHARGYQGRGVRCSPGMNRDINRKELRWHLIDW
jgi:hypothetical protein